MALNRTHVVVLYQKVEYERDNCIFGWIYDFEHFRGVFLPKPMTCFDFDRIHRPFRNEGEQTYPFTLDITCTHYFTKLKSL